LAFAWNGFVLHAAGASALRVRLTPAGSAALAVEAADETGGGVRAPGLFGAAAELRDCLFTVAWTDLPTGQRADSPVWTEIADADDVPALAEHVPAVVVLPAAGDAAASTLAVLRAWLAVPALED